MIRLLTGLVFGLATFFAHASAQTFGAEMPDGDAIPVSVALSDAEAFGEPARKFSGRVVSVCQNKGCWMMLEDDGHAVRVMMHEHSFALPKDASGRAVVYGELSVKELSEAAAEHLAEDAADGRPVERSEFRINAYAVRLEEV
jgi:hypothetical protein